MHIFLLAAQLRLRFASPQGPLTTEDLFQLPLTSTKSDRANLNDMAKLVHKELKDAGEENFVDTAPKTKGKEALELKMEILKEVIKVIQTENAAKSQADERRAQKARIMELIAQKQNEALNAKSEDELKALLSTY